MTDLPKQIKELICKTMRESDEIATVFSLCGDRDKQSADHLVNSFCDHVRVSMIGSEISPVTQFRISLNSQRLRDSWTNNLSRTASGRFMKCETLEFYDQVMTGAEDVIMSFEIDRRGVVRTPQRVANGRVIRKRCFLEDIVKLSLKGFQEHMAEVHCQESSGDFIRNL